MNRVYLVALLIFTGLGLSYLASCSDPLEINNSSPKPEPQAGDTVYIHDTVTFTDSVLRIDTINITDTLIQTDTTSSVDTVVRFDTVTVVDTRTIVDTVTLVDTVKIEEIRTIVDTVTLTDTVTRVDSVTIIEPGNWPPQSHCDEITCREKEIHWKFRNTAGNYRLEFSGSAERDQPLQTMVISIGDITYRWRAGENPLWVKDLTITANVTVRIALENPAAYGHEIEVCLKLTAL